MLWPSHKCICYPIVQFIELSVASRPARPQIEPVRWEMERRLSGPWSLLHHRREGISIRPDRFRMGVQVAYEESGLWLIVVKDVIANYFSCLVLHTIRQLLAAPIYQDILDVPCCLFLHVHRGIQYMVIGYWDMPRFEDMANLLLK